MGSNIDMNNYDITDGDNFYIDDIYGGGEEDAVEFQSNVRMDGTNRYIMGPTGSWTVWVKDVGNADGQERYSFCLLHPGSIDWTNYAPCGESSYWTATIYGYLKTTASSGTYYFYITTDDGVVFWIGGSRCITSWKDQGATEYSCSRSLSGNTWYPIYIEHYQGGGDQRLKIEWNTPDTARQLIPGSRMARSPFWYWGFGTANEY
jgi:hypothetical protein